MAVNNIVLTPDGKSYAYTFFRALSRLYVVHGLNYAVRARREPPHLQCFPRCKSGLMQLHLSMTGRSLNMFLAVGPNVGRNRYIQEEGVMRVTRLIQAALLTFLCAGVAFAQNAGDKTGGPTRNDYRLRVVQPADGSTVIGDRFQVIVDTEIPSERDTRQDVNSMPRPDVDVFLDGLFRETMRDEKNVVDMYDVQPGPHTIVLLALNRSREIIDRKEIHVEVVAPPVAQAPRPAPVRVPPPARPRRPPRTCRRRLPRPPSRCRRPERPIP